MLVLVLCSLGLDAPFSHLLVDLCFPHLVLSSLPLLGRQSCQLGLQGETTHTRACTDLPQQCTAHGNKLALYACTPS